MSDVKYNLSGLSGLIKVKNPVDPAEQIDHVEYLRVHLDIQIVNERSGPMYAWLDAEDISLGDMFMLVYNVTSRTSFDNIAQYHDIISRYKDIAFFPMMIVGYCPSRLPMDDERQVSWDEGSALAFEVQCAFKEVAEYAQVQEAFLDLIQLRWRFERLVLENLKAYWAFDQVDKSKENPESSVSS